MLSALRNKPGSASAAASAEQQWREWKEFCSAIGLHHTYLPVVLNPAAKAVLIQLEAAAAAGHPAVQRMKVRHFCALVGSPTCTVD